MPWRTHVPEQHGDTAELIVSFLLFSLSPHVLQSVILAFDIGNIAGSQAPVILRTRWVRGWSGVVWQTGCDHEIGFPLRQCSYQLHEHRFRFRLWRGREQRIQSIGKRGCSIIKLRCRMSAPHRREITQVIFSGHHESMSRLQEGGLLCSTQATQPPHFLVLTTTFSTRAGDGTESP